MEESDDCEEKETAEQRQPRPRTALGGGQPHQPETDSEEEGEDREEAVLHEVLVEPVEAQRVTVGVDGAQLEHGRQVDQEDAAEGEAADDVEGDDSAAGCRAG